MIDCLWHNMEGECECTEPLVCAVAGHCGARLKFCCSYSVYLDCKTRNACKSPECARSPIVRSGDAIMRDVFKLMGV